MVRGTSIGHSMSEDHVTMGRCRNLLVVIMVVTAGAAPVPTSRIAPPTVPDVPRDQVIGFCLYTAHNHVLKLTTQLYPLREGEERKVELEIERGGQWENAAD